MSKLTPSERVVNGCGICGKSDAPLMHLNHEDYDGWLCGACLSERWPGLIERLAPLKNFVEMAKCS